MSISENQLKSKKSVLFIIPRGEVIRNFVYSGITDYLKLDYDVHFLSVVPNDELKKYLVEKCNTFHELEISNLSYIHSFIFGLLDLAHNRYLWSAAAKVRWKMRDFEAKGLIARCKRFLFKTLALLLSNNVSFSILEKLLLKLAEREKSLKRLNEILALTKPDIVFNGSHSHAQIAYLAVQAARLKGIRTAAFLFSWDNLTSQGRIIPNYDYYFTWNSHIKNDLLKIYPCVIPQNIIVTGTPQFVGHFISSNHLEKSALKEQLGLLNHEEYFLYTSGMSHHLPYEPYVVERIADKIKEIGVKYRLVVRTYAKDKYDVFEELKKKRPDIIIPNVQWEKNYQTPLEDDQIFFSSLLKHCIAGMNVASTVSLELCIFDKPTINIGYNPPGKDIYPYNYTRFYYFDHYKPIVDSGAVEVASNENELAYLLNEAIINPGKNSEKRKALINNFFEGLHGTNVIFKFKSSINEILLKF